MSSFEAGPETPRINSHTDGRCGVVSAQSVNGDQWMERLEVLNPVASRDSLSFATTSRVPDLRDLTVGLVWNFKIGGDVAMRRIAENLKRKLGYGFNVVEFSDEFPFAETTIENIAETCDVVIGSTGDCGSCTSWLVHDMVQIEKKGVPAVALVTHPFREDAETTAEIFGMPGIRIAILKPDTLTNLSPQQIDEAADEVTDQVEEGLLREPQAGPAKAGAEPAPIYRTETFESTESTKAWEAFNSYFLEKGWSDGFPLIPPTEDRISEMLAATSLGPDEVITVLAPGMGVATTKMVAINAVMAGCRPGHLPVLIAAIKAMSKPEYRLRTVAMSTGPHAPMMVVNGPIVEELQINYGRGALGPGKQSWSNTVLGRAIRLLLMNVGHSYVGTLDLDTIGSPNKYSMCLAENEKASPWEPYHVSRGFSADQSTVTMFGVESQLEIYDYKNHEAENLLTTIAGTIKGIGALSTRAWMYPRRKPDNTVLICPDHAKVIAGAGWGRKEIQQFLHDKARIPAREFKNCDDGKRIREDWRWIMDAPDDTLVPILADPASFHVIVVGGPSGKSAYTTGVGTSTIEGIDQYRARH